MRLGRQPCRGMLYSLHLSDPLNRHATNKFCSLRHPPVAPVRVAASLVSFSAASAWRSAMMRQLATSSGQAGPRPMHSATRPLHVECTASHGSLMCVGVGEEVVFEVGCLGVIIVAIGVTMNNFLPLPFRIPSPLPILAHPVSRQRAPSTLGLVSPTLAWQKAATVPRCAFSKI